MHALRMPDIEGGFSRGYAYMVTYIRSPLQSPYALPWTVNAQAFVRVLAINHSSMTLMNITQNHQHVIEEKWEDAGKLRNKHRAFGKNDQLSNSLDHKV